MLTILHTYARRYAHQLQITMLITLLALVSYTVPKLSTGLLLLILSVGSASLSVLLDISPSMEHKDAILPVLVVNTRILLSEYVWLIVPLGRIGTSIPMVPVSTNAPPHQWLINMTATTHASTLTGRDTQDALRRSGPTLLTQCAPLSARMVITLT
jgi:hypothetical protein